jgi:hypothetical protein
MGQLRIASVLLSKGASLCVLEESSKTMGSEYLVEIV